MMAGGDGDELRRLAEGRLEAGHPPGGPSPEPAELESLVHELQVHQVELELQNEELIRANREVEKAHLRFADLYDFAPVGYFTMDRAGVILGSNITGATLLGHVRSELPGRRLAHYMTPETRPRFSLMMDEAAADTRKASCEVELESGTGTRRYVQIEGVFPPDGGEYRLAMLDISERREADAAREKLVAELQDALTRVQVLSGMLPICASCKKIRDDHGYWEQVEVYVQRHSGAQFSHGICPDCMRRVYPPKDHPYLYDDEPPTPGERP